MSANDRMIVCHGSSKATVPTLHILITLPSGSKYLGCAGSTDDLIAVPVTLSTLPGYKTCKQCGDPAQYEKLVSSF